MGKVLLTKEIKIFGKTIRTSNETMAGIGELWQDVGTNNPQNELFGIYHNYASDVMGEYDLTVGGEKEVESYDVFTIPTGKYFVLQTDTPDIPGVQKAWGEIWQMTNLNRSYIADFEWYHADGTIEIYISIK